MSQQGKRTRSLLDFYTYKFSCVAYLMCVLNLV